MCRDNHAITSLVEIESGGPSIVSHDHEFEVNIWIIEVVNEHVYPE